MSDVTLRVKVSVDAEPTTAPVQGTVLKADDEKRYLLTVALAANRVDPSVGMDGFRDFAGPAVVEKSAWDFIRKGPKAGLWHEQGHGDAAEIVESYIWRADPWVVKGQDGSETTIMPGDWLVGMILSPEAWGLYKSGEIGGVSVQGRCRRRVPDSLPPARS